MIEKGNFKLGATFQPRGTSKFVRRSDDVRVSAVLVLNDRPLSAESIGKFASPKRDEFCKRSLSCVEILGQSLLERTVARLRNAGVQAISVIGGTDLSSLPSHRDLEVTIANRPTERWSAAQRTVISHRANGFDIVLMVGLGAYMEVNVADVVRFHLAHGKPLTQLEDNQGSLDFWVVDSNWFSTAANGCTLPFRYGEFPGLPVPCRVSGYVNRLQEARDLRRLVLDAFLSRCEITPRGREVRPGIWIDDAARVHKSARLVAPLYLGYSTKIGPSAVITRFSNLERRCQVGAGTVVESATILPYTVLGSGLEVSGAVVDGNRFVDLERNIALQIEDPRLIRDATPSPWFPPAHRGSELQPNRGNEVPDYGYSQYLSRAAGRLSEVLFKG